MMPITRHQCRRDHYPTIAEVIVDQEKRINRLASQLTVSLLLNAALAGGLLITLAAIFSNQ